MHMLFITPIQNFLSRLTSRSKKEQKDALRTRLEQRRRLLKEEVVVSDSARIVSTIEQHAAFRSAKHILVYYPIRKEIDLRELVNRYAGEKTFYFPVSHRHGMEVRPFDGWEQMHRGKFGIPEPQTPTYDGELDLIILPGVGFDKQHNRLGRGGGYYDRYLSSSSSAMTIGVAYDFQVVEQIPHLHHDHKVRLLITPTEVI